MKAIIVCTSVSHGNTQKVADAMGQILDARVVTPEQVGPAELSDHDLVGFGSGIYLGSFHSRLRTFVQALPQGRQTKAFVFATSGFPDAGIHSYSRPLVRLLDQKGFEVVDTFSCRALDTFLPFKLIGGVRKGRPNDTDLASARTFAEGLRTRIRTTS
ncbi:flavodoxin [Rhodococcus sp. LBL1]|uniref:Flavodoxin n=1 Tax=Prescottella agglutinans TaxID=1644129 RepID=A0ABT6MJC7_9NOCA|nr:flavodoxin family protein [Prescottella agglutinans]MDH6284427.1 flavodoxin [Prescottella agglutinans]MDH6679687.1 flavodoxin [Rhodococcus sp. LBL1]MDH6682063.1 flavodoxin [Rhodococcus sp. LBL2]